MAVCRLQYLRFGFLKGHISKISGCHHNFNSDSTQLNDKTESAPTDSHKDNIQLDDDILPVIENRNPRNLEMLRISRKPKGYRFWNNKVQFYNMLCLDIRADYMMAYVKHWSGRIVLTTSTKEPPIRRQLVSPTDISAAVCLGRIMGRRMLECGYLEVECALEADTQSSLKIKSFLKNISSCVHLHERSQILERFSYKSTVVSKQNFPWEMTEDDCEMYSPPEGTIENESDIEKT